MGRRIGYARVSRFDQTLSPQINALRKAGCQRIFRDHGISGSQKHRPGFDRALHALQPGDTLVIWRLDRAGRSLKHLIELNEDLTEAGVFMESLCEKLDTSTYMGKFIYNILGCVAELEREIISERTKAGLEAAAAKGRFPGRPRQAKQI